MLKLVYFDFNFWRVDILRLSLSYAKIPYEYERIARSDWPRRKKNYPFGQLPVVIYKNNTYGHTHTLAKFCAKRSSLYETEELKILIIDQVLDWANEITNLIAPSIRAAIREKDPEKSKFLRNQFIKNDLFPWFSHLQNLFENHSKEKVFFTGKFTIADIVAWRLIYWFTSGKLDMVDVSFLNYFPMLKNFFSTINNYKPFNQLDEFRDITSKS